MSKRLVTVLAVLALAGCGKGTDKQAQAGGEVLPGSASDAMLPLDTVTSQPPLAPRTSEDGGKDKAEASGAPEAAPDAAAPAAPAEAAPQG